LKKVLIIDDDMDVVDAMKIALESVGYQVDYANDGTEGLEKLLAVKPNIVILDVMMSTETEGFNIAWDIRNPSPTNPYIEFKNIPILMISSVGQEKKMKFDPKTDQEFLPVNDFVEKPISPKALIEKVASLIG